MKPSRTTAKKLFGGLFAALRVRFSIYVLPSEQTPQAWFSHFHASRALIFTLVAALTLGTASAQQTITYTNGEYNDSDIVITSATNPTTLYIASGTADQLGVISDSGTSGDLYKTGAGSLVLTNANTYTGTTYIDSGTLAVIGNGSSIYSPNAYVISGYNSGDNGTLYISDGEVTEADGFLGFYAGSSGTVTVTAVYGIPSTFSLSGGLFVGDGGQGTLNISDGGLVTDNSGYLGTSFGSSGTANVTDVNNGTASTWSNSGSLTVGDYGTGTLNIQNGGIVQVGTGAGTVTLAQNSGSIGTLNIGNGSLAGTLQAGTVTGGAGTAQVIFSETDASYTFAPNLTGSLSVSQTGSGTTILTGKNTYTGNTTIDQGTLAVSGADANTYTGTTAIVYAGFASGDNGTLLISNGGQVGVNSGLLGYSSGSTGTAMVTGVNANGTASTLSMSGNLRVGDLGAGTLNIEDGGQVNNYYAFVGYDSGSSSGTVTVTGVNANGTASTWTNNSSLTVGREGTGTLNIQNGGVVQVGGGSGTLNLAQNAGSTGTLNIGNGGLAGTLQAGTVTGGSGTAQVVFSETDASYTFAPNLTGTLSVTQSGTGTTVLTGNNTYTGGTTVSAGSLLLQNSSTGSGPVTVASGATIGGVGTLSGNANISGTIEAGNTGLNINGNLTLNSTATLKFDLGSVNVQGNVTLDNANLVLNLALINDPVTVGTKLTLLTYTGTETGLFDYNGTALLNGGTFNDGVNTFQINYLSGDPSIILTSEDVVPEPSTWVILLGGLGMLVFWRARTRRSLL